MPQHRRPFLEARLHFPDMDWGGGEGAFLCHLPPHCPPPQGPKPHRRERLKVKTKLFLREELLLDPGLGTFC